MQCAAAPSVAGASPRTTHGLCWAQSRARGWVIHVLVRFTVKVTRVGYFFTVVYSKQTAPILFPTSPLAHTTQF